MDKSKRTNGRPSEEYFAIGVEKYNSGDFKCAMEYFRAAIEQDPNLEKAYLKLAEVYFSLNDEKNAKKTLYRLLSTNPENVNALNLLRQISQNQTMFVPNDDLVPYHPVISPPTIQSNSDEGFAIIPPSSIRTPFFAIEYSDGNRIYVKINSSENNSCGIIVPPDEQGIWAGYSCPKVIVDIPESIVIKGDCIAITSIGCAAFNGCEQLETIEIPNSVVSIGVGAFHSCSNIKEVYLPNSVIELEYGAFMRCNNLKKVRLSLNLQNIESGVFYNTAITAVDIPASVKNMGDSVFEPGIRKVTLHGTPPIIEENTFGYQFVTKTSFYVPQRHIQLYKNAKHWQKLNLIPF